MSGSVSAGQQRVRGGTSSPRARGRGGGMLLRGIKHETHYTLSTDDAKEHESTCHSGKHAFT